MYRMGTELIVVGLVIAALLLWVLWTFNRLVRHRNFVREGWSGIDVQLKRRADLVPNLIEIAEAYRVHEKNVLTRVTALRGESQRASGVARRGAVEGELAGALVELFGVIENYPDLKASDVYVNLQKELVEVEDVLQMARRYYNGTVRNLNNIVEMFPSSLIAKWFRFEIAEFFQLDDPSQRAVPEVAA